MTKAAYICKAKPDGTTDMSDLGLMEGCIFYGLCSIPDLLDPQWSLGEIRDKITATYPQFKRPTSDANMFWIFSRTMKVGDLVMVPKKQNGATVYLLGRVSGDATFEPLHLHNYTSYRRAVHWLNHQMPLIKEDLSAEFFKSLTKHPFVSPTLSDISRFANEISKLVDPATDILSTDPVPFSEIQTNFQARLARSINQTSAKRMLLINAASKTPLWRTVVRVERIRDPNVVAERLARAKGVCEKCGSAAPFNRKSDNTPYLEVHHIIRLADDGDDHPDNTIAVCPNCHREAHYGPESSAA